MFSLRFVAHSEVGSVRKNNQDAGYASPTMLLVTDGMGGAAAGDLASAIASTEAAKSDCRAADAGEMLERVAGMMARINSKLSDLIEESPELDGMGTTFCGALFNGMQFGIGHIGDSRGYLLRAGKLTQLTHDHSWVQSLLDDGKLTPAQAAVHPHRSLILKVLNGQVNYDPDLDVLNAQLGDRVMFCSDGLSGLVPDDKIQLLLAGGSLETAVAALAATANRNGGHDNITIIVGEVVMQEAILDAVPGVLVGSATEVNIPRIGAIANRNGTAESGGYPTPTAGSVVDQDDAAEFERYAPAVAKSKRRWPAVTAIIVAIALVLGLSGWGVFAYGKSRYFVAADDGYVAVYNGLPGNLLGFSLNALVERTNTPVKDLPRFYQDSVESTISVSSLTAAKTTTTELNTLAKRCVLVRKQREKATASPSPTPSTPIPGLPTGVSVATPSASPNQPASTTQPAKTPNILVPTTQATQPSVTEEADPEAC